MNLAANLSRAAQEHPDVVALRLGGEELTFADLDDRVARTSGWLRRQGIGRGDGVVLSLPNVPAFAVVYYATLRIGGVVVPMNPLLKRREAQFYIENSGARLVVGASPETRAGAEDAGVPFVDGSALAGLVDESDAEPETRVADTAPDDTAVILYTSGTTGRPKGAELTHANLESNRATTNETLLRLSPGEPIMGCLPLFHVFGMTTALNTAVEAGATLVLVAGFNPRQVLDVLERDEVTTFLGVPTMYQALLTAADARVKAGHPAPSLPHLRTCVSGGAALPVEVLKAFEQRFGCVLLEGYGLSETSPVASFNHPDRERLPGSIGTPIRGVEMSVVDKEDNHLPDGEVGEIVVRGENIMKGYWRDPEATAHVMRGGWFHTGDLGRRDAEGRYEIVDRAKDLIITGGYNVYPREVEEVLYEHPAVAEAAVVGLPHSVYGEQVGAYVVLHDGASATPEELRSFVRDRVASYKVPREVRLAESLPKGATGKILKRELPR